MPDATTTVDLDGHLDAIAEQGYTVHPNVLPVVEGVLDGGARRDDGMVWGDV